MQDIYALSAVILDDYDAYFAGLESFLQKIAAFVSANKIPCEEEEIFRKLLSERNKSRAEQLDSLLGYTKCSVYSECAERLQNELLHSYCQELFDIFVLPLQPPDVETLQLPEVLGLVPRLKKQYLYMAFVRAQPGLYATVYNDKIGSRAMQITEELKEADFSRPERLVYELDTVQDRFSGLLETVQGLLHKAVKLDDSAYPAKLQLLRTTTFLDDLDSQTLSGEPDIFSQNDTSGAGIPHKDIMKKLETQKLQLTQSVVAKKLVGIPSPWLARFLSLKTNLLTLNLL